MILTQEQEMIRDSVRAFAQEQIAPFAAEWDKHSTFPRAALQGLAELGVLGMVVPEEWNGAGLDYLSLVLAIEEIAAAISPLIEARVREVEAFSAALVREFGAPDAPVIVIHKTRDVKRVYELATGVLLADVKVRYA